MIQIMKLFVLNAIKDIFYQMKGNVYNATIIKSEEKIIDVLNVMM